MIKIQIKNRWTGYIIFEYEKENNSLKETIKEYIRKELESGKYMADLTRADLTGADLTGADLTGANLTRADLTGADLTGADLTGANLTGASLRGANLRGANLTGADLTRANLTGANLTGANLTGADLTRANLTGADLTRANLTGADLTRAKNSKFAIAMTRILPEGDIIGYKKTLQGVVKLLIPKEAKRSHAFGRKCRAEFAEVLELPDGFGKCISGFDHTFEYVKGKRIYPDSFDEDWTDECSNGIHFFITREEAEAYIL